MTDAERAWLELTTPSDRRHVGRRGQVTYPFRQYGQAVAWIEWQPGRAIILKLETLGGKGEGAKLIRALIQIADQHGIRITGNASPYATPERPAPTPSPEQLCDYYRSLGFEVGPPPFFVISYPPAKERAGNG